MAVVSYADRFLPPFLYYDVIAYDVTIKMASGRVGSGYETSVAVLVVVCMRVVAWESLVNVYMMPLQLCDGSNTNK